MIIYVRRGITFRLRSPASLRNVCGRPASPTARNLEPNSTRDRWRPAPRFWYFWRFPPFGRHEIRPRRKTVAMSSNATTAPAVSELPPRLMSLDALRGFDMFWIVGGAGFVEAVAASIKPEYGEKVAFLTEHPEWNGYTAYDQIFPLFMFIVGAAMHFSPLRQPDSGPPASKLSACGIRR